MSHRINYLVPDQIECVQPEGCLIEVHIVCAFAPLIRPIKTSRIAENPEWRAAYMTSTNRLQIMEPSKEYGE